MGFHNLLCGKLLGDGRLSNSNDSTPRFYFKHSTNDTGYILEQFAVFLRYLDFESTCPRFISYVDSRTKKTYEAFECVSLQAKQLKDIYNGWYDENGIKRVYRDYVLTNLNEQALAIWYQDDGSLDDATPRIRFSVESFKDTKGDIEFLKDILEKKFYIKSFIDSQKRINITGRHNVELFLSYVTPIISKAMQRKTLINHYQLLQERTRDLFKKKSILGQQFTQRTYKVPKEIKNKLLEGNLTRDKLNDYLTVELTKELVLCFNNAHRKERIKEKITKLDTEGAELVDYQPNISEFNYESLDILAKWTGIDRSEYFRIILGDIHHIPELSYFT